MVLSLQELPLELLHHTLHYLPLSDLLSFARTSKSNYDLSTHILTSLDLAIFPRKIHSLLAFFDATNDDEDDDDETTSEDPPISRYWSRHSTAHASLHQTGLTTSQNTRPSLSRSTTPPTPSTPQLKSRKSQSQSPPPTPLSIRTAEITNQNTLATTVLSAPTLSNLRSLTLRLYDLTSQALATTIATSLPNLHSLHLEFSHPYIHDTTLPARYWKETPTTGSPIWNILAGIGDTNSLNLRLRSLRSLKLTRSAITSFQLRRLVEANSELRELRLSLCRGVDAEFVNWLAGYTASGRGKIEVVRLMDCGGLSSCTDLEFVRVLAASGTVRELSLRGCKGVSEDALLRVCRGGEGGYGIAKVVSPKGVVVKSRGEITRVQRSRLGSVSPALTVSDGMVGSSSSGSISGSYFGKIEVDPNLEL